MPACFMLIDKVTGKSAKFSEIDDKLCEALGRVPDEEKFLHSWYDCIGLSLAMGKTWDEIREIFKDDEVMILIANWIEGRYTADSWYERGR